MGSYWLQAAGGTTLWSFSSITTLPQPPNPGQNTVSAVRSVSFAFHFWNFPLERWPLLIERKILASLVLADEANFSFQFQGQWALICCKCSDNVVTLYKCFEPCGSLVTGSAGRKWRHMPLSLFCHRGTPHPGLRGEQHRLQNKWPVYFDESSTGTSWKPFFWGTDGVGDSSNIDRTFTPGSFLRMLLTLSERLSLMCLLVKLSTYFFYLSSRFIHPEHKSLHSSVPF